MSGFVQEDYPHIGEKLYLATLANGMKVVVIPKPDFAETCGLLMVNFGSLQTSFTYKGELKTYPAGIAHFLEHKLFELENEADAAQLFTDLGAESNAFTTFDKTCYYFSTTEKVAENLDLLQDFIAQAHFSESSVAREKDIIKQEIDMYQDDADYRLYQGVMENLYSGTVLAEDIAGTAESIQEISVQALQENHAIFYRPEHLTLLLVGNVDSAAIFQNIQDKPKDQTQASESLETTVTLAPQNVVSARSIHMDIAQPKLAVGYGGQPVATGQSLLRQKLGLQLFFAMLLGWTSSYYQSLYESGQIDDSFDFEVEVTPAFQLVTIALDTVEPIAMSNKIRQYVKKALQSADLTQAHFETVKKETYGDFLRSLDSIDNLASQFIAYLSDSETYFDLPEILQALTLDEVLAIGQAFLEQSAVTDFTILPKLNRNSL